MKYFVLKPRGTDRHAAASRAAMRRYAQIIRRDNPQLAAELKSWADAELAESLEAGDLGMTPDEIRIEEGADSMKHEFGSTEVKDPIAEQAVRDFGQELKKITPPGYSFIAMVAKNGEGGGCFYLSNVQRESAIEMMKEMIEKIS
jgi:hypothetical protein